MTVLLKRAYDPVAPDDGARILVDRLWPRGVSKSAAQVDLWLKDVAPSPSLRQWFAHDPAKWLEFRERYFLELQNHPEAVERLAEYARRGVVTLIYAAKDREHSHAAALKDYLQSSG